MVYRNEEVIRAFGRRDSARNGRGSLRSDGDYLRSYNLVIAAHVGDITVVGDYTAPGGRYFSQTTSQHVNLAKRHAGDIMLPEIFESLFIEHSDEDDGVRLYPGYMQDPR